MAWRLIAILLLLEVAAPFASAQDPKTVIEQGLKAAGWDKMPGEYSSWKDEGKMSFGGQSIRYTGTWKLNGRNGHHRMDMSMDFAGQMVPFVFVYAGSVAFESAQGMQRDVTGEKLTYSRGQAHLFRVTGLKALLNDAKFKLSTVPGKEVDGKAVVSVRCEYPEVPAVTLSFDKESKLMVKADMIVKNEFDGWKDALDESYFSDWKDAGGGIKNFKTLKVIRGGKLMLESTMSDFVMSEKPEWATSAFEKPKP